MRATIVGCGPSGLAAAHAARGLGLDVTVLAPKAERSPIRGPLLLQRPIPGIILDHPDGYIKQTVQGGSILDYRYKLYGDISISINGDVLADGYHAWKMPAVYDALWERYFGLIREVRVTPEILADLASAPGLVINTAPADRFCLSPETCRFEVQPVAVVNECEHDLEDTIIFNADPSVPWVRSSRVFGFGTTEYRVEDAPDGAFTIRKPIATTCRCHPTVLRTGRFGAWRNETWVDTAYYDARTALVTR